MTNPPGTTVGVEPGGYAVPDPDQPTVLTYWLVDRDQVARDYPAGHRWRPSPPAHVHRASWYAGPYRAWRTAVAAAIEADPYTAIRRFQDRYPAAQLIPSETPAAPRTRVRPTRVRPGRTVNPQDALDRGILTDLDAIMAYALASLGHTTSAIAATLDITELEARQRIDHGGGLVAMNTRTATAAELLAEALARLANRPG